jgi:glutathione S-transferase
MTMSRQLLSGHQLFHFNTCPFCIKVRLALWWMGLKVPLKNIHLRRSIRAELVGGGGKQQVPCLRIESADGGVRWLYESADIIRYLKAEFAT